MLMYVKLVDIGLGQIWWYVGWLMVGLFQNTAQIYDTP